MKAVVLDELGGPDKLAIKEIDTPEPEENEVRVKLKAAALNRRDLWITIGLYPKIQLPCVTGSDGAGVIDMVGEAVDPAMIDKKVVIYPVLDWGDDPVANGPDFRVLGMPEQGTFAEYICVPAENVIPKPEHLSWEETASIPVAGLTAWRSAVTHGEVNESKRILVTGAGGGVASFAILWGVHHGSEVYVSSGSDEKIAWAQSLGAVNGVNYNNENCYKNLAREVGGFDVVIDSSGGDTINELLGTLKPGGRFVFFGATKMNPSQGLEMAKLFFRHIRLQGTTMGSFAEFKDMMRFISEKQIKPVVGEILDFDDIIKAHEIMESYSQTGKIVLKIN
jgi:NADPH:quinone reductase-like Zn-dependent oxidoreductase